MSNDLLLESVVAACRSHSAAVAEAERVFGEASANAYRAHGAVWEKALAECSRMRDADYHAKRLYDYFTESHQEAVDTAAKVFAASMSAAHRAFEMSLWESSRSFVDTCNKLLGVK